MLEQHISIGYFSTKTGLSIRALRLYDQIGLLKPALITGHNKYRYYESEQIPLAQEIKLYRDSDLPLEEIRHILNQPSIKQQTLEQHLERLKERLIHQKNLIGQVEQLLQQTR